ncbi:hypothetical protein ACJX0J_029155, partial [Zea mays]
FNVTDREVTGFSTPNHPTSRRWMTGTIWRHATRWASWHWRTTPPSISWAQTRACYSRYVWCSLPWALWSRVRSCGCTTCTWLP